MTHVLALLLAVVAALPADTTRDSAIVPYLVGLLHRGEAWTPERNAATDSLQMGHLANMGAMHKAGLLIGAGPMLDDSPFRGVWFFRADSLEQIRAHVARDPAIQAGRLRCDLMPWWGPRGIGAEYERRAAGGAPDSMVRYVFGLLRSGPRYARGDSAAQELRPSRLEDTELLVQHGRVIMTGACGGGELLSLYVFSTPDTAVARRWTNADATVRSGRIRVELHPWMVALGVVPGH